MFFARTFLGKQLYIVVLLLLTCMAVQGQDIILFHETEQSEPITDKIQIFEDGSGVMAINEVVLRKSSFKRNLVKVPHYFSTSSAIWQKAKIFVPSGEQVFLQIGYAMMDTIELFVFDSKDSLVAHKTAGSYIPLVNRDLAGNYPKFKLLEGTYTYYIRVKATYTLMLPIYLKSYKQLYEDRLTENIGQGAYGGFAVLIALYTFFLWLSLRDKVYLFYILHIIGTAIITLHIGGYTFLVLWPETPLINHYEPSILGLGIFSISFAIIFLETANKFKTLDRWLKALLLTNLMVFPIDLLGFHKAANYLVQALVIVSSASMLIGGIISYRKGFKSARFFLLAWTFFLIGVIITTLQRVGVLPYEYYFVHASQIGSALDMVLLSLALADRINILQYEKEKAFEQSVNNMRENRELVRQQNALLSLHVDERTKELDEQRKTLEHQKEQLQEMNKTKDKIFSVIAHDLRGPLANVSTLADMMDQDESLRTQETMSMLKDASKQSFNLLDNLLLWAKAQYGDAEFQKSKVDLQKLAETNKQLYYLKARAKDIKVENNIPEGLYADVDGTMIETVVRNLISNALKYTLVGGKIEIGGRFNPNENTVIVWVKDSGLGIAPEKLPAIFEAGKNKSVMGTDGETGTGLGLVICKDFVEKNKGSISAASKLGKGTTFTITLPAFGR